MADLKDTLRHPHFHPGDRVRVRRDDGQIEDNWSFASRDPDNRHAIVVAIRASEGTILHKAVPWDEFTLMNPIPIEIGASVITKRSSGETELDWKFAGLNPDNNNAIIVRPETEGKEILIKEIPWEEFVNLNLPS